MINGIDATESESIMA